MENLKQLPLTTGYTRIQENVCHRQLCKHNNQQHRFANVGICILAVVFSILLLFSMVYLYSEYHRLRSELDIQKQVLSSIIQGGKLNSSQTKKDHSGGNNFLSDKSLLTKLFLHQNNSAAELILNKTVSAEGVSDEFVSKETAIERQEEVTEKLTFTTKPTNAALTRIKREDGNNRNKRRNGKSRRGHNKGEVATTPQPNQQNKVIHLVIDKNHEHLSLENPDIKTGPRGQPIRYWKFSDTGFNYEQGFANLNEPEGSITILESGVYFIYSQMTYFDRSGRWSHLVSINERPFIKCMASEWGIDINPETNVHYNTIHQCYTAAVAHISVQSKVTISGMYPDRIIHPDKEMSFWGIIKLA